MHLRRLILMLTVAALMAALLVVNAVPASAQATQEEFVCNPEGVCSLDDLPGDFFGPGSNGQGDDFFRNVASGVDPDARDFLINFFA
jgi:hypothetical protein